MQSCPFGSPRLHFEEYPWPVPRPACDCEAPTVAMLTHVPSLFLATLSSHQNTSWSTANWSNLAPPQLDLLTPSCTAAWPHQKRLKSWQNTANLQRRCFASPSLAPSSRNLRAACMQQRKGHGHLEKDTGPHLEAFWNLNEGSKIQSTKITSINLLMKAAADLASIRIVSARTCVSVQTTANGAVSLTAFSQFGRFVNRSYAGVDPNLQSIRWCWYNLKPRQDRCQSWPSKVTCLWSSHTGQTFRHSNTVSLPIGHIWTSVSSSTAAKSASKTGQASPAPPWQTWKEREHSSKTNTPFSLEKLWVIPKHVLYTGFCWNVCGPVLFNGLSSSMYRERKWGSIGLIGCVCTLYSIPNLHPWTQTFEIRP